VLWISRCAGASVSAATGCQSSSADASYKFARGLNSRRQLIVLGCKTLAPKYASSAASISVLTVVESVELGNNPRSAVNTPLTSVQILDLVRPQRCANKGSGVIRPPRPRVCFSTQSRSDKAPSTGINRRRAAGLRVERVFQRFLKRGDSVYIRNRCGLPCAAAGASKKLRSAASWRVARRRRAQSHLN